MAVYETGAATDTTDMITKLITFATANGWTVDTPASGKVFSKGGIYFGLNWDTDDVWVCGATGYNAGSAWSAQPGASASQCRSNEMAGPYVAYHFFTGTTPDYLHVVVEKTSGVYKHFMIGQLVKHGTFTGGEYVGAVFWDMTGTTRTNYPDSSFHAVPFDGNCAGGASTNRPAVRADIDSKTDNWMQFYVTTNYGGNYAKGCVRGAGSTGGTLLESLHERSPSEFNQLTPFLPMLIAAERPSSLVSPLGYVPDLRYVNMTDLTPGDTLTIGTDEWMVFPFIQKTETWENSGSTTPSSGKYGFAYRKN